MVLQLYESTRQFYAILGLPTYSYEDSTSGSPFLMVFNPTLPHACNMSNPVCVWTTVMSIDIKYEIDAYKPAFLHMFT